MKYWREDKKALKREMKAKKIKKNKHKNKKEDGIFSE